ncbi:hypothetical protein BWO90_26765 [Sinorhizobium meliloti]|nr:hypothetical protein BWO76_24945 [Sinorhizobium meliloti]ATB05464.1 hypothetical protein BWO90_26765 [Sinorhizobium meliloti]
MPPSLQRRASDQTRKGRCSTLICCMFLSFNRIRLKDTCRSRRRSNGLQRAMRRLSHRRVP